MGYNWLTTGFLAVKTKQHTNILSIMEPFPSQAAWFLWRNIRHPQEPLQKGSAKAIIEGLSIK
jgi:hypothetical protein